MQGRGVDADDGEEDGITGGRDDNVLGLGFEIVGCLQICVGRSTAVKMVRVNFAELEEEEEEGGLPTEFSDICDPRNLAQTALRNANPAVFIVDGRLRQK
jgi:hypothetical protein